MEAVLTAILVSIILVGNTDLLIRPIRHRLEGRVRAHVLTHQAARLEPVRKPVRWRTIASDFEATG